MFSKALHIFNYPLHATRVRERVSLCPFYRWTCWTVRYLNELPKGSQQIRAEDGLECGFCGSGPALISPIAINSSIVHLLRCNRCLSFLVKSFLLFFQPRDFFLSFFFFFFFLLFRATLMVYESSQARGQSWSCWPMPHPQQCGIWATSVTYTTVHGNTGSLIHWVRPGIEPMSSWMLVGFITAEAQQNSLSWGFLVILCFNTMTSIFLIKSGGHISWGKIKSRVLRIFPKWVNWNTEK